MPPKSAPSAKAKGKAQATPKATVDARPAPAPTSAAALVKVGVTSMVAQKKDISNFLGVMKYRGAQSKQPGLQQEAMQVMAIYNELPDNKKNEFVSKFFAEGGSKNKNFDWTTSYKEEVVNTKATSSKDSEGFLNRKP